MKDNSKKIDVRRACTEGGKLMEAVKEHAQYVGATSIELNVWGFNHSAISFYVHLGFKVQKSTMEIIL